VINKGKAVITFKYGKLDGSSLITAGEMAWPIIPPRTGERPRIPSLQHIELTMVQLESANAIDGHNHANDIDGPEGEGNDVSSSPLVERVAMRLKLSNYGANHVEQSDSG
jgi:hypothetical protein